MVKMRYVTLGWPHTAIDLPGVVARHSTYHGRESNESLEICG